MTNAMPMLTDSEREELIAEIDYNRKNCFLSSKTELLMQVAEAALKAQPTHQVQLDDAWVDLSEGAMKSQMRHGATARTIYTAPPVPALKLPDEKPVIDKEEGNDIDYMEPSEVYELGKVDGFNKAIAETKRLNGVTK